MSRLQLYFNPDSFRLFAREIRRVSWFLLLGLTAGGAGLSYNSDFALAVLEWLALQLIAFVMDSIRKEGE
jgi:hypothetical protein